MYPGIRILIREKGKVICEVRDGRDKHANEAIRALISGMGMPVSRVLSGATTSMRDKCSG